MRTRREYLAAFATILGSVVAGCTGETMSQDEAESTLEDVTVVGGVPDTSAYIVRGIDSEAGVVLYTAGMGVNHGGGLTAIPIDETDL